jgi:hypothetical protein
MDDVSRSGASQSTIDALQRILPIISCAGVKIRIESFEVMVGVLEGEAAHHFVVLVG